MTIPNSGYPEQGQPGADPYAAGGQPSYGYSTQPQQGPEIQSAPAAPPGAGTTEPQVIELSDTGRSGGMVKCEHCGSTDIRYVIEAQALVCANCRSKHNEVRLESEVDLTGGIEELNTTVVTSSAQNLVDEQVVTLKCSACGAEVVLNVTESVQARCHWCRNYLSQGSQIRNGAVPDAVCPFLIPKEHAVWAIRDFVKQRQFYAHPRFKREFAPENVVGVYLPFFVFDGNASAKLSGEGEIETARWTETDGDDDSSTTTTYYASDVYHVARSFDMAVDDLLLEASSERADFDDPAQTNNIINAILPFDVKNAVRYNPNYLRGFTSERRDVNVSDMSDTVQDRLLSIARARGDEMIDQYDRGVRWDAEAVDLRGSRWVCVYLPVWLYSYYQESRDLKHFVAVNGQNGNVMGSVPVNMPVLVLVTILVFILGTALAVLIFLFMVASR